MFFQYILSLKNFPHKIESANMNSVNFNKIVPFIANLNSIKPTSKTTMTAKQDTDKFADYSVFHVMANNLPSLTFKGIHHDSVLGIETRITGISQHQDNATRLKFRFLNRNLRGENQKIHLRLEKEPDNTKDPNAIAIYHDYQSKPMKLGYLTAPISAKIKPLMNKGFLFDASVINVAGGKGSGFPNVGVRIRLEYLSSPNRTPNNRKVDKVKKAFQELVKNNQALSYREEKIYTSKTYKKATKLKIDNERNEATAYKSGWEQLQAKIIEEPKIKNSRKHPQKADFTEHFKNAVKFIYFKFNPKQKPQSPQQPKPTIPSTPVEEGG